MIQWSAFILLKKIALFFENTLVGFGDSITL